MTLIAERDWPVQQPPADFPERTVTGMLTPVRLAASSVGRPTRQWLYWFLAAVFVSGSALGFTWSRYRQSGRAANIGRVQALPLPRSMSAASLPLVNIKAPAMLQITAKPKLNVNHAAKPQQKPTSTLPQPRTPACQCERGFADFICDCY